MINEENQITNQQIWIMLVNRMFQSMHKYQEMMSPEKYEWLKKTVKELETAFSEVENSCLSTYGQLSLQRTDVDREKLILSRPYPSITMLMVEGIDYKQEIWDMVYPKNEEKYQEPSSLVD